MKTYKKPPPGIDFNNPVFADYAEAQLQEWQVQNEITFLRVLRKCRNIVKLRSVYESDMCIQLVMSYADLGTLKSY